MKSKIIFLATLVAVLFTTQISATVRTTTFSDGTNVNFSTIDKTLKISVRNVDAESVAIFLEDTEGVTLVSETVEVKPNFVKAYRLENLPNGKYHFIVKRNGVKVVQYFDITPIGISLSENEREETLLPALKQKGDKIYVSSFVKKGGNTSVRIMNNEGGLVFEDNYNDEILRKTFDLSKLQAGVYFFEVQTADETEYFTVVR